MILVHLASDGVKIPDQIDHWTRDKGQGTRDKGQGTRDKGPTARICTQPSHRSSGSNPFDDASGSLTPRDPERVPEPGRPSTLHIPHSTFHTPHSTLHTPHSTSPKPKLNLT
jgi:hypothetical protein